MSLCSFSHAQRAQVWRAVMKTAKTDADEMIYFLFSFKISFERVCEKSVIFRKIYFHLFTIRKTSIVCNKPQEISTLRTSEFSRYLIFNLLGPVAHFKGGFSQFFSIQFLEGQISSEYVRRNLNLVDADFYFPYWV